MDWANLWNVVWYTVLIFAFIAYLIVLFMVLTDLFREQARSYRPHGHSLANYAEQDVLRHEVSL